MSGPRVFSSIREAIHATATSARIPMKALAGELDWSPSELSHRTTLGGESAKPFPADDEHLVKIQTVTGDFSILATMADRCGFELNPKRERLGELLTDVQSELKRFMPKVQMILELSAETSKKGSR